MVPLNSELGGPSIGTSDHLTGPSSLDLIHQVSFGEGEFRWIVHLFERATFSPYCRRTGKLQLRTKNRCYND